VFGVIDTQRHNSADVHQNLPKATENSIITNRVYGLGLGLGSGLVFRLSDYGTVVPRCVFYMDQTVALSPQL